MMQLDDGQKGVVVYSDEGNLAYKNYLDGMVPSNGLSREKAGDVVEAILGMLWLHQMEGMTYEWVEKVVPEVEQGIMDLVETDQPVGMSGPTTAATNEMAENIEKVQALVQKVGEIVQPTKDHVVAMLGAVEMMREAVMTVVGKLDNLHDVSAKGRSESLGVMTSSATALMEVKNTVDALSNGVVQMEAQKIDKILVKLDEVGTVKKDDNEEKKTVGGWSVVVEDDDEKARLRDILEGFRDKRGEWLDAQTRTQDQVAELLDLATEDLNDGLKGFQARLYKTIDNYDEDNAGYGFQMEGKMWIGIGDLEHWARKSHSRSMSNLMSVIRGTQDFHHLDNAYRLLVLETATPGQVFVFVGCHYSKARGSRPSSSWQDDSQSKRRKW